MGIYDSLKPKLVQSQNMGQAYQFVETRNAETGFVALGQVSQREAGSRWVTPQKLYEPIRQVDFFPVGLVEFWAAFSVKRS